MLVDAANQLDLLLQRELGQQGVRFGLNGGRVGHGSLGCSCKREPGQQNQTRQAASATKRKSIEQQGSLSFS